MSVISLEDRRRALLRRRAWPYGMDVMKWDGGGWALIAHGMPKPELVGTLAAISADLDILDRQSMAPNEDIVLD